MARERATLQVGGPTKQGTPQQEEDQLPEWWNPNPALHVSLYYKEEVHRNISPGKADPVLSQCNGALLHCPSMSMEKSKRYCGPGRHP